MESVSYHFTMEEEQSFALNPSKTTTSPADTSELFIAPESRNIMSNQSKQESIFSPHAAPFQGRTANDLFSLMTQQEPRAGDTAPSAADIDLMNLRIGSSDYLFESTEQNSTNNFSMGSTRAESVASSHNNMWSETSTQNGTSADRKNEMIDTFEFLIKSVSSADSYVSMLTRDQLSVLRSIRPSLLYELLQEVARVRSEKRMRRALPTECAFCKNNGENEESYSSHALKDYRGRVLCPVLRAFRCPRCGASGDRAHTIKYCPETMDSERMGLPSRRRMSFLGSMRSPSAPHSPAADMPHSSLWGNFDI